MSESKHFDFQAEVRQLLDIVIHSLYSNRDVFLRELISNASDALDKRRFLGLTDKAVQEENLFIKLIPDKAAGTLTVRDNGIGMTEAEVVENIGTIAKSGSKAFLEQLKKTGGQAGPSLIGQFGVGFYSSFMVAERVRVLTRKAGQETSTLWESDGRGGYTIERGNRDEPGTDVILHLRRKGDDKEVEDGWKDYAEEWELRDLVKRYSDFITYPIKMDVEKEKGKGLEEQILNSMKALWTRPKAEVKKEEYDEFYKKLSHDHSEPLEAIPFSAEGTVEYQALLYIPGQRPMDLMYRDGRFGLSLYVKRVFILSECEKLLPSYLRFVRGLVDAADMPLNVSREMLQQDRQIEAIRNRLTRKILETLAQMKEKNLEKYLKFWELFGQVLKEGLAMDFARCDELKELILFTTTKSGKLTDLAGYLSRMPEGQKEIYYITGDSMKTVESSPLLEVFRDKGFEVIFFADHIDGFAVQGVREYKGKSLRAVGRGDLDLKSDEEKKAEQQKEKDFQGRYGKLLEAVKEILADRVKEVRFSKRLKDSAVCLVADDHDLGSQMEKFFEQMGQAVPKSKKILELNPEHGIVAVMGDIYEANRGDPRIARYARLLHDQALLSEGLAIEKPADFARDVAALMVEAGRGKGEAAKA